MRGSRVSRLVVLSGLLIVGIEAALCADDRIPRPEFESDYAYPVLTTPDPRSLFLEYFDVVVLFGALVLTAYLVLRKRSRTGIFFVSIFSIAYFGFFREGCVCPVGSLQNIVYAIFNPDYAIPAFVVVVFALPLVSALLFGRIFCSSVCPLGALQDLVSFRPMKLPAWLAKTLGFFPVLYLALAVLAAAAGSDFIICRFDPFISFYRLGGSFNMLLLGAAFIVLGIFVARPYCRFVCPYGVLLGWFARLSWRHATITPDHCIRCRLCEEACPVEAIRKPTGFVNGKPGSKYMRNARRQIVLLALFFPFFIVGGGRIWDLSSMVPFPDSMQMYVLRTRLFARMQTLLCTKHLRARLSMPR